MPQMSHPTQGVKVVPDVLVDRYRTRGWVPTVLASNTPDNDPDNPGTDETEEQ